jgi:hypothetical protein
MGHQLVLDGLGLAAEKLLDGIDVSAYANVLKVGCLFTQHG